jgi:RNA polymerase sigma-70 factor (ECF subfamily)
MPATPNEPPGDPPTDLSVDDRITLDESLSRVLVAVLSSLTPAERVAFVLHDVFGVPFRTISDIVGRSPDATRTLARTARQRIRRRHEDVAPPGPDSAVVRDFSRACAAGEQRRLEILLDPGITVTVDSGGTVRAPAAPVRGVERTAQLLIALFADEPAMVVSEQSINGQVGLLLRRGGQVVGTVGLNVRGERILDVWVVANPDKLRHWNTP